MTIGEPSLPEPDGKTSLLVVSRFTGADFLVSGDEYFKINIASVPAGEEDRVNKIIKIKAADMSKELKRVFIFTPGMYAVTSVQFVNDPDFIIYRGDKKSFSGIEFELFPDTISILPYEFEVFAGDGSLYISDIPELGSGEEAELRQSLSSYPNYELWKH